jgi:hypothetical protein
MLYSIFCYTPNGVLFGKGLTDFSSGRILERIVVGLGDCTGGSAAARARRRMGGAIVGYGATAFKADTVLFFMCILFSILFK